MLVDSHAHLDVEKFQLDREEVLARAWEAGLSTILTVGCVAPGVESLETFWRLLSSDPRICGSIGVHPHDARFFCPSLGEELGRLAENPKVVAWGEIGLDFYYDHSPQEQQIEAFRQQLRLARVVKKPVIIHCRDAEELTAEILEEEFENGPGGVLHCFTGSAETADRFLGLGLHISLGGIVTFPKSEELRRVARGLPPERLLIETDSPYLAPAPHRGKRNEPAFVARVAEVLGEIRDSGVDEIATLTGHNFQRLFGFPSAMPAD